MGYILPINHEQYTQYVNRTVKSNQQPFTLTPVNKPTIDTKLTNQRQSMDAYKPVDFLYDKSKQKQSKKFNEILSELTGKGANINEYV